MTITLQETEFYTIINQSNNPAHLYLTDPRLDKDIWTIQKDLPSLNEESHLYARKNLIFKDFKLQWLKSLTKIVFLTKVSRKQWKLETIYRVLRSVINFDNWIVQEGYSGSFALTLLLIQRWGSKQNKREKVHFQQFLTVLRQIGCINFTTNWKFSKKKQQVKTIPEEVKHQLDKAFKQLEQPIYTLFKLLESLGCRVAELSKIPLNCLRKRKNVYRIRLATGKEDDSKQEQDLPDKLVPLVEEQQSFIKKKFGENFPWLFCNFKIKSNKHIAQSFPPIFSYYPEQIKLIASKLNSLIARLVRENDIRANNGQAVHITTHQFRRTYATVARRMGKRADQIQHSLRHLNLDMQDHYVNITPQELEKEFILINKDGQSIIYKTDLEQDVIRREWKIREVEIGICGRPNIHQKCQSEYICLGCEYAFYSENDLIKLDKLLKHNQKVVDKCHQNGYSNSRRAYSASQQIKIITNIINQIKSNL